jgi:hypothetical protein
MRLRVIMTSPGWSLAQLRDEDGPRLGEFPALVFGRLAARRPLALTMI